MNFDSVPSPQEDPREAVANENRAAAYGGEGQNWQFTSDYKREKVRRQAYERALGKTTSDAALNEAITQNRAANLIEGLERDLANAADPQQSEYYLEAEGFNDSLDFIIDQSPDHRSASAGMFAMRAAGVESNPDGSYTLKLDNDTKFDTLSNGAIAYPAESSEFPAGDPRLN